MQDHHDDGPSLQEMNRQRLPYVIVIGALGLAITVLVALSGVGIIS